MTIPDRKIFSQPQLTKFYYAHMTVWVQMDHLQVMHMSKYIKKNYRDVSSPLNKI